MRYIFRNTDGEETIISVDQVKKLDHGINQLTINGSEYFLKSIGAHTYFSNDKLTWEKIGTIPSNKDIVLIDRTFKAYRGYKPSGLTNANPGSLLTQMPGKVVKINVKEGDEVKQGQTLLILEAMKMENEIKAGMDGVVKLLNIEEGQALDSGHLMIELE
jgi:biotin carboxyl carrier protein